MQELRMINAVMLPKSFSANLQIYSSCLRARRCQDRSCANLCRTYQHRPKSTPEAGLQLRLQPSASSCHVSTMFFSSIVSPLHKDNPTFNALASPRQSPRIPTFAGWANNLLSQHQEPTTTENPKNQAYHGMPTIC